MYSSYFLRIFSTLEVISPGVNFLEVTAISSYRKQRHSSRNPFFPAHPLPSSHWRLGRLPAARPRALDEQGDDDAGGCEYPGSREEDRAIAGRHGDGRADHRAERITGRRYRGGEPIDAPLLALLRALRDQRVDGGKVSADEEAASDPQEEE